MSRKQVLLTAVAFGFLLGITVFGVQNAFSADKSSIFDWKHRTQLSANGGFVSFASDALVARTYGVGIGGAITYSLTSWADAVPPLDVYATFDHVFPLPGHGEQVNLARVQANLHVYPGPEDIPGRFSVFVNTGPVWKGETTIKDMQGWAIGTTGTWRFVKPLVGAVRYEHVFAQDALGIAADYDMLKVVVNAGWVF